MRPVSRCLLFLLCALVTAVAGNVLLLDRQESIAFDETASCGGDVVVVVSEPGDMQKNRQVYLCQDAAHPHQAEKRINVDGAPYSTEPLVAGESFRIAPQSKWELGCDYGDESACHLAGIVDSPHSADIRLDAGEFLIRLEEETTGLGTSRLLIALTLSMIIAGLLTGWRFRKDMPRPALKSGDGILCYILSLLAASALSIVVVGHFDSSAFLPSKALIFANNAVMFVSLFGTAGLCLLLRNGAGKKAWTPDSQDADKREDANSAVSASNDEYASKILGIHPMIFAPVAGLLLAIIAAIFVMMINDVLMTTHDLANQFAGYRFSLGHFAMLAAVSEELLYRGVIQTSIGGRKPTGFRAWLGISVAAVLFMLVHVPQSIGHLYTLIPVFSLGFLSGWTKQKTGTIFPSMAMHLSYNTSLLIPSFFI